MNERHAIGGQSYRGFIEPILPIEAPGDLAGAYRSLVMWRRGVDTVADSKGRAEHATIYVHTSCDTCTAIRRDWRTSETWLESSYWQPLRGAVPDGVLLDMGIAELHATHHLGERDYGSAVIFAGIRVLVDHYTSCDFVSTQEMRRQLGDQWDAHNTEMTKLTATARADADAECAARLREAQIRIANVEALVLLAFRAKHKKMDYAQVRAAIEWCTGEPVPPATLEEARRLRDLQGRSPQ